MKRSWKEEVTGEKEEVVEISTHAIHGESNFFSLCFYASISIALRLIRMHALLLHQNS